MNPTVALPGSMTWMGIRLSSGSRSPQSPKGLRLQLTQSVFCSYGPVVVEWPEMLCAWSSQYPHRPIPAGGAQIDPRDDSRVPHPFVFGFCLPAAGRKGWVLLRFGFSLATCPLVLSATTARPSSPISRCSELTDIHTDPRKGLE